MKKSVYLFLVFCIIIPATLAYAESVEIVSSSFHVWGATGQSPDYTYDFSGSTPQTGEIPQYLPIGSFRPNYAYSSAGYFYVTSNVIGGYSDSYAEEFIIFTPLRDFNQLTFTQTYLSGGLWNYSEFSLFDVEKDLSIWNVPLDRLHPDMTSPIIYDFEAGNAYTLHLFAHSEARDDSTQYTFSFNNLSVSAVPEPITILLLGFGLIGLTGLRKYKI